MEPSAIVDAVGSLVRTHKPALFVATIAGWSTIGLASLRFGLRARSSGRGRETWLGVAAISLLFAFEMAFPHRHDLTERLRSVFRTVAGGPEAMSGRKPVQVGVILLVSLVALGLAARFLPRRLPSGRPAKLTAFGVGIGLFSFTLEIISLHQIDDYDFLYWVLWLVGITVGLAGVAWQTIAREVGTANEPERTRSRRSTGPGHATYRLGDIGSKPSRRSVGVEGSVSFVLATACVLYVFGHARVNGADTAKFVGGLGSALLFGAVGAALAGLPRRSLVRVLAFGLAFGALGITFNLALHPSSRPFWSADILQGMALSGMIVAVWRRAVGGSPWSYAALGALGASWWLLEPDARNFPGSQYLYATSADGSSLFPLLPWLTLSALGAWLIEVSTTARLAAALVLGALGWLGWSLGPVKFPLSPTYAMLGGSLASLVFAASGFADRSKRVRAVSGWLGRSWLVFFYLHLGLAPVLERAGLTSPLVGWVSLALLSLGATWLITWALAKAGPLFATPATWIALLTATVVVGFVPGLPGVATIALAGGIGLLFASRTGDLARLILGPELDSLPTEGRVPSWLKLATLASLLAAPELVSRLPEPYGRRVAPLTPSTARPVDLPRGLSTP